MIYVLGGGGAGLNFKVVGGTSQPTNPRENTIWVNTSTTITDWVFSATQPTGSSGMVWFSVGTSSSVEFNALKKNAIQIYPLSAKQHISGKWVDKTAKTYQNSKWNDWWNGELYQKGQTTGWSTKNLILTGNSVCDGGGTIDYKSENMTLTGPANGHGTTFYYDTKVDLTKYTKLTLTGYFVGQIYTLCAWTDFGTYETDNRVAHISGYNSTANVPSKYTLDVSALSGKHYIGFVIDNAQYPVKVEDLRLS